MMNERANGSETENRNVNANATVSVNPTEYISSNTSRGPRAASLTKYEVRSCFLWLAGKRRPAN